MADDHQFLACLVFFDVSLHFPPNTKLNHINVKFNDNDQILDRLFLLQTVLIGIGLKKLRNASRGRVWWVEVVAEAPQPAHHSQLDSVIADSTVKAHLFVLPVCTNICLWWNMGVGTPCLALRSRCQVHQVSTIRAHIDHHPPTKRTRFCRSQLDFNRPKVTM